MVPTFSRIEKLLKVTVGEVRRISAIERWVGGVYHSPCLFVFHLNYYKNRGESTSWKLAKSILWKVDVVIEYKLSCAYKTGSRQFIRNSNNLTLILWNSCNLCQFSRRAAGMWFCNINYNIYVTCSVLSIQVFKITISVSVYYFCFCFFQEDSWKFFNITGYIS